MSAGAELPNVAIIGRPNVGKSALFNRLAGRKIAIVHNQPGITRDRLSAKCTRGEKPFAVWDTGGIFGGGETELTAQVRATAQEALQASDLILFVVDAKTGLSPVDADLARMLRKSRKAIVLVVNKIDDPKHEPLAVEFDSLGFGQTVSISAEHNRGITELLDQIEKLLPEDSGQKSAVRDSEPSTQLPALDPQPIAVAIIGRPNVGKSSLINAVMRSERAIVSEVAGTTRDSIDISYTREDQTFLFIDTAGIRRRGKVSSSVEVFSVMRAERSVRRADLCVLIVDLTSGVTAQDKRIGGLIQEARKAAVVILNKWDLVKPKRGGKETINELVEEARQRIFFLDYAPVIIASARTGENVERLFRAITQIERASSKRIGTGALNRLLRSALAANPPPMVKGRRLKLFYATQAGQRLDGFKPSSLPERPLAPPELVLFVNDPRLMPKPYLRYLEARIREAEPFPGLPILLTLRPRGEKL
jgi:GTPase